jgi:hypothetical protein
LILLNNNHNAMPAKGLHKERTACHDDSTSARTTFSRRYG